MMYDYFQDDITVGLEIEPYKGLLREIFGDNVISKNYDTRLFYDRRNPKLLTIIIYYESPDYLFDKFEQLRESGIDVLSLIKPKYNTQDWEHPKYFDFSNSNLLNIHEDHPWDHNRRPVVLTIDNVDVLVHDRYSGHALFQLTYNVYQHLDEYVKYGDLGRCRPEDRFIEQNNNRETNFGPVNFILSLEHSLGPSENRQKLNVIRDAYLSLNEEADQLRHEQLVKVGSLLCLLMSLYWEKEIDYFIARIRVNNIENYRTIEKFKYSDHTSKYNEDYLLKDRYATFYDFVESVNYEKAISNSNIMFELVPRVLKVKGIDDVSGFMILYNVIEKIRNYCMENPVNGDTLAVKEEFNFSISKTATKKFIENKLKEISEIVEETDVEEFEDKAKYKVSFIKKTQLIDQFDSLLTYLDIDSTTYDIEFTDLIKIRNNIYHGKLPSEDLKPYIKQMKEIIYDLILKLMQD
nr:hypothetical protein [uncultured Carboxylicivirga sp.]